MVLQSKTTTNPEIFRFVSFSTKTMLLLALSLLIASYGTDALRAVFSLEGLQGRISERANERVGSGLLALVRQGGLYILIIFAIKCSFKSKSNLLNFAFISGYSIFALLISGSKYQGLLLPFIFFVIWYYRNRSENRNILNMRRLIFGSTIGLFLVGLMGYMRGAGAWEGEAKHPFLIQVFYQLSNAFDAPDNLIVLLDRTETWIFGDLGPRLLADYLIMPFIPRFLWADKPLVSGNQLVMQEYFPERFGGHLGEAISPSLPGEMMLTGGLFYMAIWLTILGFLCGRLYFLSQTRGKFYLIAHMWVLLNIFNFQRSGTGTLGSLIRFSLVALAIYCVLKAIHFAVATNPSLYHARNRH